MEEQPVNFNDKAPITLNLDEFDLDSFELKPINKGLGFHDDQKREKMVTRNLKQSSSSLKKSTTSANLTGNKFLQNSPQALAGNGLMSGVEAIYGTTGTDRVKKSKKIKNENVQAKLKDAGLLIMLSAFVIDLSIITLTTSLLLSSFYILGFAEFSLSGLLGFIVESSIFALLFFSLTFLSYFSLLEPVGTIGKRLLSLKVCQSNSTKPVTIRQSFTRGLVTLMSLLLAGIPLVLDFQGKLSDSRVIQK